MYGLAPAIGLVTGPILARTLGPEGRGDLAALLQPLTVAAGIACLGVPPALTYFIASGSAQRESIAKAFALVGPVSVAAYLGMTLYGAHLSSVTGIPFWIFLVTWLAIPLGALLQVVRAFWHGRADWARLELERSSGAILRLVAVLVPAAIGYTSAGLYAGLQVLASTVAGVFLLSFRPRFTPGTSLSFRGLTRYALGAWPALIFLYAGSRLDQALMPAASSTIELGYYAVAVTVAEVPLVATALIYRDALQLSSQGVSVREVLRQGSTYWVAAILSSVGAAIASPTLVPLFFGEMFRSSVSSIQILCLSTIMLTILQFCVAVLVGRGYPRLSSVAPSVSVLATGLGFVLLWGDISAVSASFISVVSNGCGVVAAVSLVCSVARSGPRAATIAGSGSGGAS